MKKVVCVAILILMLLSVAASAEEWVCSSCGNIGNGNFCSFCGSSAPVTTSKDKWVCPVCGNNAFGKFCSECGNAKVLPSNASINLGDMEIFQNRTLGGLMQDYTYRRDKYLVDNYNNEYTHSLSVGKGSLTYLLNHNYLSFKGTVACPKGLNSDAFRSCATLSVYGDDKLIVEFLRFNDGSRPEPFSIDVAQYERLKLEWECLGENIWLDWGDFATIFDGVLIRVQ